MILRWLGGKGDKRSRENCFAEVAFGVSADHRCCLFEISVNATRRLVGLLVHTMLQLTLSKDCSASDESVHSNGPHVAPYNLYCVCQFLVAAKVYEQQRFRGSKCTLQVVAQDSGAIVRYSGDLLLQLAVLVCGVGTSRSTKPDRSLHTSCRDYSIWFSI